VCVCVRVLVTHRAVAAAPVGTQRFLSAGRVPMVRVVRARYNNIVIIPYKNARVTTAL
jgi:hypothetical protein